MSKAKKTGIESLAGKYARYSIVGEIERNILSIAPTKVEKDDLLLSDVYCEENYDLELYTSLRESIEKEGFSVPLIVIKNQDGKFEIINGVKRFLIGKKLGLEVFPVAVAELSDERKFAYLLENIQNEKDSPYVRVYALNILNTKYGLSIEDLATLSSCSISQIRNLLRLCNLPPYAKKALVEEQISYGEARLLLNLSSANQRKLFDMMIDTDLSVRELEKKKKRMNGYRNGNVEIKKDGDTITIRFEDKKQLDRLYPRIKELLSD